MSLFILVVVVGVVGALFAQPRPVEVCDSAVIVQAREGLALLRSSPQAGAADGVRTAVYEGTVAIEAHLARPHEVRTQASRVEFAMECSTAGVRRLAVRETTGGRAQTLETTLVVGDRAAVQASAGAPFKELSGGEAAGAIASAHRWLPRAVVGAALAEAASVRVGGALEWRGERLTPVSFAEAGGGGCTLLMDAGGRVVRVERLVADQRLGDVCEWTAFEYGSSEKTPKEGPSDLPTRIGRFIVAGGVTVTYTLELVGRGDAADGDAQFDLPAARRADVPNWSEVLPQPATALAVKPLADGLFVIEVPSANARVMVIEREKDLVVLEAPDGDATCGELIRTLSARFPGKNVGTVAFGHHHPSYTGGLRAFAAEGAEVLTPRGLEAYIRLILARPTTLGDPAVAAPAGAVVATFEGERTIEAGENTVRLIDIGELSSHTEHYTIFYFPKRSLLFQGDLGYFPVDGATRVNPRLTGLADAVTRFRLSPTRLVQSWPLKGTRQEVPWDEVQSLTAAENERVKAKQPPDR